MGNDMDSKYELYSNDQKNNALNDKREISKGFHQRSGNEILEWIFAKDKPRQIVKRISHGDFYWLVKQTGNDDCFPLLKLASEEQWQYLLDMEIWDKDLLSLNNTFTWLGKLEQADSLKLIKWFYTKGQYLLYLFLYRSIQVAIREDDEFDCPDDFFTLDGLFYIKIINNEKGMMETIERILRAMSQKDYDRYQRVLLGLAGVIPSEIEEEMYRLRNIRMAEHGFLPFEEAIAVYAYLASDTLKVDAVDGEIIKVFHDEDLHGLTSILSLYHTNQNNILFKNIFQQGDPLFEDRIRLELAGLCNQLLVADRLAVDEFETLLAICNKAMGYISLALEYKCGNDISYATSILRNNSLVSVFRVGFGLVLELKWEAETFLKKSWFQNYGLDFDFWGDKWGRTLTGLMEKKPHYDADFEAIEGSHDFQKIRELEECADMVHYLIALDKLIETMISGYLLNDEILLEEQATFYPLLFNYWARKLLKLEPEFLPISQDQVKKLFSILRLGEAGAPFSMSKQKKAFVDTFMGFVSNLDIMFEDLKEALALIWNDFDAEYQWVSVNDLDRRFSKYIWVES